jgi:hypothetical protein
MERVNFAGSYCIRMSRFSKNVKQVSVILTFLLTNKHSTASYLRVPIV